MGQSSLRPRDRGAGGAARSQRYRTPDENVSPVGRDRQTLFSNGSSSPQMAQGASRRTPAAVRPPPSYTPAQRRNHASSNEDPEECTREGRYCYIAVSQRRVAEAIAVGQQKQRQIPVRHFHIQRGKLRPEAIVPDHF